MTFWELKFTDFLELQCSSNTSKFEVSKNAFRSSQNYTTELFITNCNLQLIDFAFLTSFNNLNFILFDKSVGLQQSLQSLPNPLPKLTHVRCTDTNLNGIVDFPVLSSELLFLVLPNAQLDDDDCSRILDWIATASNATLVNLYLSNNNLTKIPSQISKFSAIENIWMSNNRITTLPTNAITIAYIIRYFNIFLDGNEIHTIEPNAFNGSLSCT